MANALFAQGLVLSVGGAAPEREVPVAEVAQQRGERHDDCLRRDAVQAQLDQHRQGDGVDAQRGEVDALEAHEVTQHVAPDAEHEPPMHHEGEQHAQHMR